MKQKLHKKGRYRYSWKYQSFVKTATVELKNKRNKFIEFELNNQQTVYLIRRSMFSSNKIEYRKI